MRLCTFGNCMNIRKWHGLCTAHDDQMKAYGRCFPTRSDGKPKDWRGCTTPECIGVHKAQGLCARCYMAKRRKEAALCA
ncbi:hypothetical protein GCM10010149_47970 [Nonomuraea roseoviolacea subsp. roseoviolacea]